MTGGCGGWIAEPLPPGIFEDMVYFPFLPPRSELRADLRLNFKRRGRYCESTFGVATRFPFPSLQKPGTLLCRARFLCIRRLIRLTRCLKYCRWCAASGRVLSVDEVRTCTVSANICPRILPATLIGRQQLSLVRWEDRDCRIQAERRPGLRQEDFLVYEDDHSVEVTHFSADRVPVSLGITLDTSGSMAGEKIREAETALDSLRLRPPRQAG